jgi:predicted nucleic acid-binding protein
MMQVIKVFIDSTGWFALVDSEHGDHEAAKEYFKQILDSSTRLYTNITEITSAITKIKGKCGLSIATDFSKLIDQSILSTNLNVSWLTHRLHRAALKQFFSIKEPQIEIRHCLIFEEIKKKKINIIFSFDDALKSFGIPLMPQA